MTEAEDRSDLSPSRAERRRIIELLCDHFAADALSMEEFEERLDAVHRAGSAQALRSALHGLPARGSGEEEAPVPDERERLPASASRRRTGLEVAVFAENTRRGRWVPAERIWSAALMGAMRLDFREAALPAGVTELSVLSFWGAVEVVVPPDLEVEAGGVAIMGSFGSVDPELPPRGPGAPSLRVRGASIMGDVHIWRGYPGEKRRQAKRRMKRERRARRREAGTA